MIDCLMLTAGFACPNNWARLVVLALQKRICFFNMIPDLVNLVRRAINVRR